jgi:hypothetical protein
MTDEDLQAIVVGPDPEAMADQRRGNRVEHLAQEKPPDLVTRTVTISSSQARRLGNDLMCGRSLSMRRPLRALRPYPATRLRSPVNGPVAGSDAVG